MKEVSSIFYCRKGLLDIIRLWCVLILYFNQTNVENLLTRCIKYICSASGWGKDIKCCEFGERCRWLSSTKHREFGFKRKRTTVHPLHSKRLHWIIDQVWCGDNGKECCGDWEKQHSWIADILIVAGYNIFPRKHTRLPWMFFQCYDWTSMIWSCFGQRHHATVSIVHAVTKDPEQITRNADIVVAAAGVPNLVRGSWLKRGAVVLDVGTCPIKVKQFPTHSCFSLYYVAFC